MIKMIYSNKGKIIVDGICRLTYCINCEIEEPISYIVKKPIWYEAGFTKFSDGIICMYCLEKRLDRRLTYSDLNSSNLNEKFFKPLIFLDIDGVLNNHESHERTKYCSINKAYANNLDNLLVELDMSIVLTSAWRYLSDFMNLKGLRNLLHTHWVDGERLIGWTRKDKGKITDRGLQITEWLEQHHLFKNYVVVDDIDLDITKYKHPYVQTDWGLNEQACNEIRKLLCEALF